MGSELEAGPEMDRLVAEACGYCVWKTFAGREIGTVSGYESGCGHKAYGPVGDGQPCPHCGKPVYIPWFGQTFKPSTDWNDAMLAAEKINLAFNLHREHSIEHGWIYAISIPASHGQIFAGSGASGPELICLAILRVKHA